MHGLITTSLQRFLRETYGAPVWAEIATRACVPDGHFESMLIYPEDVFDRTLEEAEAVLGKDSATILEDMGTFLISSPDIQALRRLLRFSGSSFSDFLNALEDLRGRARLAVPALDIPSLELNPLGGKRYRIDYTWHRPEGIHVIAGVLRAMADDYGALAFTETLTDEDGTAYLEVSVLDRQFAEGREFDLGAMA
ncbi:heme NO-binding domain-containing protein [Tropicimonas sp. S265A]|uniref:heme NO-binding domain-containing protein n=1 Tax=Tropicimonas sp. S265A TaxID=3415134 RepID=UPI003C7A0B5B